MGRWYNGIWIEFDPDIFSFSKFLGFDPKSVLGDFATVEALIAHYERKMGVDKSTAEKMYFDMLAQEIESYLTQPHVLGARRKS